MKQRIERLRQRLGHGDAGRPATRQDLLDVLEVVEALCPPKNHTVGDKDGTLDFNEDTKLHG